jgi:hypothetical protein
LLGDAGEGLRGAPLGEPAQQLRCSARLLRRRGDGRCRHTGLGRPSEGGQALQWLPIREADDLIISVEDEPFLGAAERTDGCVLDVGALNRYARSGILC